MPEARGAISCTQNNPSWAFAKSGKAATRALWQVNASVKKAVCNQSRSSTDK